MADLVVGRSEGIAYTNNNLTYRQFTKNNLQPSFKKSNIKMTFIDEIISKIKQAKSDKEIKEALCEVYYSTQVDSKIRDEFDECYYSL